MFGCGWGPITVATNPNVTGRDFGNWVPASLTVEKQLWPSDDPGRFDLIVNGVTVKPAAGDGDKVTIPVPPGTYNVSESAAAGTDPAAYDSTVSCRTVTRRRSVLRSGTAWNGLVLRAGNQATCTFVNVRKALPTDPVPAIALEKSGPALAEAGDTLRYTLYVTNPGRVAIPASGVNVTDNRCDDPPALAGKNGDTSPQTLDPGDTWTYACSYKTPAPGADCEQAVVINTATATGTVDGVHRDRRRVDHDHRGLPRRPSRAAAAGARAAAGGAEPRAAGPCRAAAVPEPGPLAAYPPVAQMEPPGPEP